MFCFSTKTLQKRLSIFTTIALRMMLCGVWKGTQAYNVPFVVLVVGAGVVVSDKQKEKK